MTHLAYADDCIIFTNTNQRGLTELMAFMRLYEEVSGQQVNLDKSSFILGTKALSLQTQIVRTITGFRFRRLPMTYLGTPLYKGNRKVCLFDDILARMRDKVQSWEMVSSSHGGQLTLIKSVLQSILLHLFQVLNPPKLVVDGMENLFN